MSVGNIRKLQENTAALYTERKTLLVSVIRRSGYVYPEKLKRSPLPSGCEISGCKMSGHAMLSKATPSRFPIQVWDICASSLSGSTPSGFLQRTCGGSPIRTPRGRSTRHSWTSHSDDSISYLDMLSGHRPCSATILSGRPVRTSFTPCIPDCLWQRTSKL